MKAFTSVDPGEEMSGLALHAWEVLKVMEFRPNNELYVQRSACTNSVVARLFPVSYRAGLHPVH